MAIAERERFIAYFCSFKFYFIMTTVKIKFRSSSLPGKSGSLYFSLVHQGKSAQVTTKYKVYPGEWDEFMQRVVLTSTSRDKELVSIQQKIQDSEQVLRNVILYLEKDTGGDYSVKDIVCFFKGRIRRKSFFSFMDDQIVELNATRRFGTAQNYYCARQSFCNFLQGQDLLFQELTENVICEYDQWLKRKGLTRNTISFYMRTLRAVCNKAAEKYFFSLPPLFERVYTGVDKTRKRATNENVIVRLLQLDLRCSPSLGYARDLFLFSFYTRGMAFVDIAYLKKSDIKYGVITYIRRKTGKMMFVRLEHCMQEIIDRHSIGAAHSGYLFPLISSVDEGKAYEQYKNALCTYNKQLKKISGLLGLPLSYLSSYVARHTWATVARNKNVPLSIISAGMGHGSETTTQIYLASLETSIIDDANHHIISGCM